MIALFYFLCYNHKKQQQNVLMYQDRRHAMSETKYQVYAGVLNYTITLDEENKIKFLKVGNELPYYRNLLGNNEITERHLSELKSTFKRMIMLEPKMFKELYDLLQEHDQEMFIHAKTVVEDVKLFCSCCLQNETVN